MDFSNGVSYTCIRVLTLSTRTGAHFYSSTRTRTVLELFWKYLYSNVEL